MDPALAGMHLRLQKLWTYPGVLPTLGTGEGQHSHPAWRGPGAQQVARSTGGQTEEQLHLQLLVS